MRTTPDFAFDEHTEENDRGMAAVEPAPVATRRRKGELRLQRRHVPPAPANSARIFCSRLDQARCGSGRTSRWARRRATGAAARNISTCHRTQPRSRAARLLLTGATVPFAIRDRSADVLPDGERKYILELHPLDRTLGNLTPSGLHFERHHGGIPTIDPAKHILYVHGMVDGPA